VLSGEGQEIQDCSPELLTALVKSERTRRLRRRVVAWFNKFGRQFAWRVTKDPYEILLSELLLQKTDAAKVVVAYPQFLKSYPNPQKLARASLGKLARMLQSIGLVKRAGFLKRIGQKLVREYDGQVPRSREALLSLPSVGDYAANAVLCLAYGERYPLLDGSTSRVIQRIFNLKSRKPAWADSETRAFLGALLPRRSAREFNLGLLDIAAAHCRPTNPKCASCPVVKLCEYGKRATRLTESADA
jgi:A/G-specific adenine glycosylase